MDDPRLIVIAGPTGSGKSDLAVRLAEAIGGEIVNFDSVQLYRGFDIGSAKPSMPTRARVPHHLYDILDATDEFHAAAYGRLARETCNAIIARGKRPILVGGTFFYLRALLEGLPEMPGRNEALRTRLRRIAAAPRGSTRLHAWLSKVDPASGMKIAPGDRHRVERALEVWIESRRPISSWTPREEDAIPALKLALTVDRTKLAGLLDTRVERMYAEGLVEETRGLLARFPREARPFGTIGYREAAAVVAGETTRDSAVRETQRRTRAYAKRQMTWLRSERNVQWLDAAERNTPFQTALRLIEGEP